MNDDTKTIECILPVRGLCFKVINTLNPPPIPSDTHCPFCFLQTHFTETETESPNPHLPGTKQAVESQAMWLQVHVHKQQHKHAHG